MNNLKENKKERDEKKQNKKKQNEKKKLQSSEVIAVFALILIVVSLANIGIRFTGHVTNVTDTAVVNVTITTSAAINFTTDFIDFGDGMVDAGYSFAQITTEGGACTNGNWSVINTPLVLENIGNQNITLWISSDKTGATLLGGTNPKFSFLTSNSSGENGCTAPIAPYQDFSLTPIVICNPLQFYDSRDSIDIDIRLRIPSDSFTGAKTATITATAQPI